MGVKLGLAFYGGPPDAAQPGGGPVLTDDNLIFARQLGVTHVIQCAPGEHLLPVQDGVWAFEDLVALRSKIEAHGLTLYAIENWHPTMWGHVLLGRDGPEREREMTNLQQTVRNMGRAGIGVMGYYFSVAGPGAQVLSNGPYGRGGARSIGYIEAEVSGGPRGEENPVYPFKSRVALSRLPAVTVTVVSAYTAETPAWLRFPAVRRGGQQWRPTTARQPTRVRRWRKCGSD